MTLKRSTGSIPSRSEISSVSLVRRGGRVGGDYTKFCRFLISLCYKLRYTGGLDDALSTVSMMEWREMGNGGAREERSKTGPLIVLERNPQRTEE